MVVQVDGGHTSGQDVHHPNCHNAAVQPVLLVEGTVAHLWTVRRRLRLVCGRERGMDRGRQIKREGGARERWMEVIYQIKIRFK